MPQVQLPIFPEGTTLITAEVGFERRDQQVVYLSGHLPVFTHLQDDLGAFRLFTSQLIVNGVASQGQIGKSFGISLTTVKRCLKRFRERGATAFFTAPPKREGSKLTPERLARAQALLDQAWTVSAISAELGVLATTLHKAIAAKRLHQKKRPLKTRAKILPR